MITETQIKNDPWVLVDSADDSDYVLERFEVRLKGKKPLVIQNPTTAKLVHVTAQYLGVNTATAKAFVWRTVVETPEPQTLIEYESDLKTIEYLEREPYNLTDQHCVSCNAPLFKFEVREHKNKCAWCSS
ncbi:hypothetical protein [Vibrio parahaemolyticus]|uniref:hypothetical protein n=1 Tax=Vibrio parahaemolyticus TaxID=670 RepID=UPI002B3873B0|nr:hypothetical protein [Vibrio harveyi]